jgi:hypothetical protein
MSVAVLHGEDQIIAENFDVDMNYISLESSVVGSAVRA